MNTPQGYPYGPFNIQASAGEYRLYRLGAAPNGGLWSAGFPAAGQSVDGVGLPNPVPPPPDPPFAGLGYPAMRGLPVLVETGGAFAAGASLDTDGNGRVVVHGAGVIVMRALEASGGAGQIIQAVFA